MLTPFDGHGAGRADPAPDFNTYFGFRQKMETPSNVFHKTHWSAATSRPASRRPTCLRGHLHDAAHVPGLLGATGDPRPHRRRGRARPRLALQQGAVQHARVAGLLGESSRGNASCSTTPTSAATSAARATRATRRSPTTWRRQPGAPSRSSRTTSRSSAPATRVTTPSRSSRPASRTTARSSRTGRVHRRLRRLRRVQAPGVHRRRQPGGRAVPHPQRQHRLALRLHEPNPGWLHARPRRPPGRLPGRVAPGRHRATARHGPGRLPPQEPHRRRRRDGLGRTSGARARHRDAGSGCRGGDYDAPEAPGIGRGVAFADRGTGGGEGTTDDHPEARTATAVIGTPIFDQGTGTYTTLMQVTSEELGVALSDISVEVWNTDELKFDSGVAGSRATRVNTAACFLAAEEVRAGAGRAGRRSTSAARRTSSRLPTAMRSGAPTLKRAVTWQELLSRTGEEVTGRGHVVEGGRGRMRPYHVLRRRRWRR